jgi:hypothetical protein
MAHTKYFHSPVAEKQRRKYLNMQSVSRRGQGLFRPVVSCLEAEARECDLTTSVQLVRFGIADVGSLMSTPVAVN